MGRAAHEQPLGNTWGQEDDHMKRAKRQAGFSLLEVLISSGILAALMAGGLMLSGTLATTSTETYTARTLTQDARDALGAVKDDLRIISRTGSVTDPEAASPSFRADPDRPGSTVLSLTPTAAPQDQITYYLEGDALYRAHRTSLDTIALAAKSFHVTVNTSGLIEAKLVLEHADVEREHTITARFRNP